MTPLFTLSQIRALEQQHGSSGLMEKAGRAAAMLAAELVEDGLPVLVLAGPGNNGGDALVAAKYLKAGWHAVDVVFTGDAERLPPDAHAACETWRAGGDTLLDAIPAGRRYGLVIDGLFGIGLNRAPDSRHGELIQAANALPCAILALDVPSGLCADTGRVFGQAIVADHTLTFIGHKPGLFTLDGPDHAGQVHCCDLGIDPAPCEGFLVDTPPTLPAPRRRNAHKGDFGSVAVLGGTDGMAGAALLAARAALLGGAGRVYGGLLADTRPAVDPSQPELMLRDPDELLAMTGLSAWVAGPGLGRSAKAESAIRSLIHGETPLVLDADALHLLAANPDLARSLRQRTPGTVVLTPHPGEAGVLLGCPTSEVQSDRVASALAIARQTQSIVVLKGCGSVIATPDGRWFVNASGNPALSAAGTGDVLAGLIGSLAAQGMALLDATRLAVWLHGAAADRLVADGVGPIGLTASEVALEVRNLLNEIVRI